MGLALVLGPLAGQPADVLQASRQPVALALELLEAQQARPAEALGRGDARRVGGYVREGVGDDLRELPLEPGHLAAQ